MRGDEFFEYSSCHKIGHIIGYLKLFEKLLKADNLIKILDLKCLLARKCLEKSNEEKSYWIISDEIEVTRKICVI